jgi:hypothetical protein
MHPGAPTVESRSRFSFHGLGACLRCGMSATGKRFTFLLLVLSAGLALVPPCRGGGSVGFESTGSLVNAHFPIIATLLPNGTVLVTGGAWTGPPGNAELYDPASGTWAATGSLTTTFSPETAMLLPNGKVLVTGTTDLFTGIASAELYDPASGTWTVTGSPSIGHGNSTATMLPNGKVLLAGGFYFTFFRGYSGATAELYDPTSGTWISTGSLAAARHLHTATLLPSGKVLVAAGEYDDGSNVSYVKSAELYDPASGTWTSTGSVNTGRIAHTATMLPNGMVLAAGGDANGSAELYNPASETWTLTGNLATVRGRHTATLLPSHKVLVAGGIGSGEYLMSAELYDVNSGTWTATGNLGAARFGHTATLLPNHKVLVAGGQYGSEPLVSAELYTGPPTPPILLNISTRLRVQTGDNAMIGGFIITGTEPKTVIVRGIGPSLALAGALADPVIEVHSSSGELLATNDNWRDGYYAAQVASTLPPSNDLESALWGILNPGAYTVVVRGKDNTTGIGLFEVYDLDQTVNAKLANISTRGLVQTDDNVLIGGFIVGGGTAVGGTATVVVRALGPSVPLTGILGDPTLELRDSSGALVASNDNWKRRPDGSSQQAEIEATTIPPTNDLESALVQTLPAGNYTAIVQGKNGTTGVGLVEVYHLQ